MKETIDYPGFGTLTFTNMPRMNTDEIANLMHGAHKAKRAKLVEYGIHVRVSAKGPKLNPVLSAASARVLAWMIDEEEELVVDGIKAYVGLHQTHASIATKLLQHCLIKDADFHNSSAHYYEVTPDAIRVLEDPSYEPAIDEALRTGKQVFR